LYVIPAEAGIQKKLMRILVFSDTHLTDQFEPKKFAFLKKIISDADFVIINGDFWDGQLTSFEKFISSPWKKLFPLLKAKKAVYLFGNHDRQSYSDKNVNLFSNLQANAYRMKINGKKFIFEHGNRILPMFDEALPRSICKYTTIIAGFFLEKISPLKFILKRTGQTMKNKVKKEANKNEVFVCGHSHFADFDLKNQYINTGFIENGVAGYLIIDGGKIIPKFDRYS